MALDFPTSPNPGEEYGNYYWDATLEVWRAKPLDSAVAATGTVPPEDPKPGDLWYNTIDGTLFVYYYDSNTYQWVEVKANSTLGTTVADRVTAIENTRPNVNYIINGGFEINQRNFTSATIFGYNFDRWYHSSSGGTATCSAQTFTPGTITTGIGDATNYVRIVTSGQSGANDYAGIQQRIEDVRTLAGQTVTISFWARAASGTPKVGFTFEQSFGSGGSPSANVITSIGSVTISSSWARYSYTTTVPSIAGKTIGTTANSSSLGLELWTSMGSGLTAYSNIGIQNTQIDFWGVQLEAGAVATPFRRNANSIQGEFDACQRYYQVFNADRLGAAILCGRAGTIWEWSWQFVTPMRTTPTGILLNNGSVWSYTSGASQAMSWNLSPRLNSIWVTGAVNASYGSAGSVGVVDNTSIAASAEL